jgi:hypothetical protein
VLNYQSISQNNPRQRGNWIRSHQVDKVERGMVEGRAEAEVRGKQTCLKSEVIKQLLQVKDRSKQHEWGQAYYLYKKI